MALNVRANILSTSVVTVFVWEAGVNYRVLCWLYGLADWEHTKDNKLQAQPLIKTPAQPR